MIIANRMHDHDSNLATAFDGQAANFERAPVQSDPAAIERLVQAADLPSDSLVLDAGCGPGLVSEALLRAGHRVFGVDRYAEFGEQAGKAGADLGLRFARQTTAGDIQGKAVAGKP